VRRCLCASSDAPHWPGTVAALHLHVLMEAAAGAVAGRGCDLAANALDALLRRVARRDQLPLLPCVCKDLGMQERRKL